MLCQGPALLSHLRAAASSVVYLVAHYRSRARAGVAEPSKRLRSTRVVLSYPDDQQAPACLLYEVFASSDQRAAYSCWRLVCTVPAHLSDDCGLGTVLQLAHDLGQHSIFSWTTTP